MSYFNDKIFLKNCESFFIFLFLSYSFCIIMEKEKYIITDFFVQIKE